MEISLPVNEKGFNLYDWDYQSYRAVIDKCISKKLSSTVLDNEHGTYAGDLQLIKWANDDGYKATIKGDGVKVVFNN